MISIEGQYCYVDHARVITRAIHNIRKNRQEKFAEFSSQFKGLIGKETNPLLEQLPQSDYRRKNYGLVIASV